MINMSESNIPIYNQTTPSGSLLAKLLWQHTAPSHELVSAVIMIFITTFLFALPWERPRCLHFSLQTKKEETTTADDFFTCLCGEPDAPLQHAYKNKSPAAASENEERMMIKSSKQLLPWQKAQKQLQGQAVLWELNAPSALMSWTGRKKMWVILIETISHSGSPVTAPSDLAPKPCRLQRGVTCLLKKNTLLACISHSLVKYCLTFF